MALQIIGYFLSVFMGMTLGLIGAGGSILAVPILVYFLKVSPVLSTSYSLLIVGITALFGGITYFKKGEVNIRTALSFSVPSLVAVYITRRWLLPWIPDPVLVLHHFIISKNMFVMLFFSILMAVSGFMMIKNGSSISTKKHKEYRYPCLFIAGEGLIVGILTGIVGAGGGFLIIPALVLFANLDMKLAVGNSLIIITIKSLFGFLGDIQANVVLNYQLLSIFVLCTSFGMLFGSYWSKKVSSNLLKKVFGWFTLVLSFLIFFYEILK